MQATSDKTASANFTQNGEAVNFIGIVDDVTGSTYGRTGYNPYYQWGRKDAFRSAQYTAAPASGSSYIYSATSVKVGITIQTPTTHYNGSGNPYNPYLYNAWNATYITYAGASTTKVDGLEKVIKTVYDPCPVGYTVPPANTFIAFKDTDISKEAAGCTYTSGGKNLFFPHTGRRRNDSGNLAYVGGSNLVCYWQAVSGTSNLIRLLTFTEGAVATAAVDDLNYSYRCTCNPIRPVSENVRQH